MFGSAGQVSLEAPPPLSMRDAGDALLIYVDQSEPGFRRKKVGNSFAYYDANDRLIRAADAKARIRALAIPPAYTDVWICSRPDGHIQATGRDERGRKQYRYHPRWTKMSNATKFSRMLEFARALPVLREKVALDLQRRGLPRQKVLAAVVCLLEKTLIRIGNSEYARDNNSFGLTTLRNRHIEIDGAQVKFEFRGKSGKLWRLSLTDRRMARVIRNCQELPGQHLFQYVDDEGARAAITSADVNDYLREIAGSEFTAKDFRTWAGTWLAATELAALAQCESAAEAKRNVRNVIAIVASRLGNTPTICRKCYIHPAVLDAYLENNLNLETRPIKHSMRRGACLTEEEARVVAFLRRRLRGAKQSPGAKISAHQANGGTPSAAARSISSGH